VTAPRQVARPRVLSIGFFTAGFGLTLLLAVVVVQNVATPLRFLLFAIPAAFAALAVRELLQSAKSADERAPQ
jgi:membrane protein implicated in regulation of membrane protease activity